MSLKKLLLIGYLFFMTACGQDKKSEPPKTANDSTGTGTKATVPDSQVPNQASVKPSTDLTGFILQDYTILDTSRGDLNLDQYPDMIMVLKKNGEDSTSDVTEHPEKRPLLILIGQADNSYKLAARSDNAVYCVDCGGIMGDPFMGVVIKNGYFSVEHYGGSSWRWERTITFKYSAADTSWYLHKDGHSSFHASDESKKRETKIFTTKDFGKVPFAKFDIYKD